MAIANAIGTAGKRAPWNDVSRYCVGRKFDAGHVTRYSYKADFKCVKVLAMVSRPMSVSYFKRYRMELDLRGQRFGPVFVPPGYRLMAWEPDMLAEHAVAKFHSFRNEIDADVFNCLADLDGCQRLMHEISLKDGFLPEATWLAAYTAGGEGEYCGTIQGIRASHKNGAIQNVGITPLHRGRGVGTALISAALLGFQQVGLSRAYLEVTAQNDRAVRLYKRLGFRRTKTLFKAVELAYS